MSSKIAVWSGEECDLPKPLVQVSGTLHCLNDSFLIISTDDSTLQVPYQNKATALKIPSKVVRSACTNTTSLFVTIDGEVWGFSSEKNNAVVLRKDSKTQLVKIDGLSEIVEVALGKTHAAAIDKSGVLYSWGIGEYHQLGDLLTTKHGPIPVKSAEIFNAQQVVCGEKYTCIRTLGGFVYIFGDLDYSKNCTSPVFSKQCPYTLQGLEEHFITKVCNNPRLIAALTSSGLVFLFDACLKLVKLSLYQKEILNIAATENSLIAIDKSCLYQWKEASGPNACGLKNWTVKVFLLNQNFVDVQIVGGFGKNLGIYGGKVKGSIGKVIRVGGESEDIQISDNLYEETQEIGVDQNFEIGIRIVTQTVYQYIRINFHRLAGKIKLQDWKPYENEGETHSACAIIENILGNVVKMEKKIVFDKFVRIFSKNSSQKVMRLQGALQKYHQRYIFVGMIKNLKILNKNQKQNIKFGCTLLNFTIKALNKSQKASAFTQFLYYEKPKSGALLLSSFFNNLYTRVLKCYFSYFFEYISQKKLTSLQNLLLKLLLREQKYLSISLSKFFGIYRLHLLKNISSESKKSSETSKRSEKTINYKLKISPAGNFNERYEKNIEIIASPRVEKHGSREQSPRSQAKRGNTREGVKLVRNSSKPNQIERNRPSEYKNKAQKIAVAEEIKARQIKNKLLKLSSYSSLPTRDNELEKSPEKYSSNSLSPVKIAPKIGKFAEIIKKKIYENYKYFFSLPTTKKNSAPFIIVPDKTELSPSAAPEIWKLKVFALGINKLNTMTKKYLKNKIFFKITS